MLSKSWFIFVFYVNYLNVIKRDNHCANKRISYKSGPDGHHINAFSDVYQ